MEAKKLINISKKIILAIDSGTSSSRVCLINKQLSILDIENKTHSQISKSQGWTEHNPDEIYDNIAELINKLKSRNQLLFPNICGISITNQRETAVCWNKKTGKPYCNAIVWHDTRTDEIVKRLIKKHGGQDFLRKKCGLPMNTYFTGGKIRWIIENVPEVELKIKNHDISDLCFGTIDSWLIYVIIQLLYFNLSIHCINQSIYNLKQLLYLSINLLYIYIRN